MKTYLLDIIPKIQRFSQKLDNTTLLTNKHWVVIDEERNRKIVFIFREKDSQLLVSENGKIEKGTWEYLGNNSLLIERKGGCFLFKHGFIDDTVLALKVDGKEEYALLVNEVLFDNKLNSVTTIFQFLNKKYRSEIQQGKFITSKSKEKLSLIPNPQEQIRAALNFTLSDYPELSNNLEEIKIVAEISNQKFASEILISFCRDHSLKLELTNGNPVFAKKVANKEMPLGLIEQLFKVNFDNKNFISDLESFIKTKLSNG